MEYSSNKKTKEDFNSYVNNLVQPKESPMNEFVNLNDSQYATPTPLTDEQLEKLLETKPAGEIVVSTDDGDEAEEDKVLN